MYLNVKPVSGTTPTDLPTLNTWAPYGPMVKNLQLHYYASDTAEFNGFLAGNLDLTDWPLPAADYPSVESNPDFQLSPLQEDSPFSGFISTEPVAASQPAKNPQHLQPIVPTGDATGTWAHNLLSQNRPMFPNVGSTCAKPSPT